MKRKFEHPIPASGELTGPKYWRSLEELTATPGFREHVEREFPEGAASLEGVDRRQFFKLMAASFALGGVGMAGCRRPEANILPYGKSVEQVIPGLPLYFATSMPLRRSAIPLLAETHQGRPTKLEGNPSYLPHGGSTTLMAQASILDLYDPDRATAHTKGSSTLSAAQVNDLLADISKRYSSNGGAGLAFLAGESSSPTRARLVAILKAKYPRATWAEYEAITDEPPVEASRAAFGRAVKPVYRFAKAKRIVSLDCDFLSSESGSLYYAREFAKGRRTKSREDEISRLYVAESNFTITGSMADHRLRLASSHVVALATLLASKIVGEGVDKSPADGIDIDSKWVAECAKDLSAHRGESLVVAGSHQPAAVHALVYRINASLGSIGRTVDFVETDAVGAASIESLAAQIKGGAIKSLIILGGNPVYDAPANLEFGSLLKSVPEIIRYGYYTDETSVVAGVHLAAAHYLESWGDHRTADGTIVPIQPMILPLFNGLTDLEILARIAGEANVDPYGLVFQTVTKIVGGDAEKAFRRFLHDGLLVGSEYKTIAVTVLRDAITLSAPKPTALSPQNLEVRFVGDLKVDDGRFNNNGWLQECPDPITKLAWDNAIIVSPRLAAELGLVSKDRLRDSKEAEKKSSALDPTRHDIQKFEIGKETARWAKVSVNGRSVEGPIHIQVGLSNYTIILPLGYGRSVTGHIGTGTGFNAYSVRTSAGREFSTGATITLVEAKTYKLANSQEHWSMEGRDIIREANLSEYRENPTFVRGIGMESHAPNNYGKDAGLSLQEKATLIPRGNSLYKTPGAQDRFPGFEGTHQWGMSIDLNTCIGCNACVVACQAENNIPIVGKDQVLRGREMHWIRLDRYYSSGSQDSSEIPEDPQVSLQPMTCQHCELAPCETVCPVNATVHDNEGINTMAYNRCIGTRYCANNCPYKVRRFNYFDFNKRSIDSLYMGPLGRKEMPELVKMGKNPDVTVRMRGVMEKCTYCVQRIQQAKIAQKVKAGASDDIVVPDGTIKTACQQVCPVEAIVFGNINDPESAVSKAKADERDYAVLGYLNIRPRTTYIGKVRNPNPEMPDYKNLPLSRIEYNNKNHPAGMPEEGHEAKKESASISTRRNGGLV